MMDNISLSIIHSPYFPFRYSATSSISGKRVALLIESVSSSFNIVSLSVNHKNQLLSFGIFAAKTVQIVAVAALTGKTAYYE